ncbi:hypothetical protein [Streptomyces sp. NPDC055210]
MAALSNSYAQPIPRATDLSLALPEVEQLLGITDLQSLEVDEDTLPQ